MEVFVPSLKSLSKSKLLAFRQCEERLWLEVHRPEIRDDSESSQTKFDVGHLVGNLARARYDPNLKDILLIARADGFASTFQQSLELLSLSAPLFEAGFAAEGAVAFADVMLPVKRRCKKLWRMVAVKSSTRMQGDYPDDVTVQASAVREAGVPLDSIVFAYIDKQWISPSGGDYASPFAEIDLAEEFSARKEETRHRLLRYLGQETYSMVRLREVPAARLDLHL